MIDPELLKSGTRIGDDGRYVIASAIAIGGMAVVYHARDTRLGDNCAVKAMAIPSTPDAAAKVSAFHTEAKIVAKLLHPGIVAVRDYFVEAGNAFLVMDFVPGCNLYDQHKRPAHDGEDGDDVDIVPVPDAQVVAYGRMLAATLAALHRHKPPIIYRDLKPHNIMRRAPDDRLVLLDFGIAHFFRPAGLRLGDSAEPLGTPGYAAPEQYYAAGAPDARTDIYSLGAVLHELSTGHNPRGTDHFVALPRPKSLNPDMSPTLAQIIEKCTNPEPENRYQSAEELANDLENWRPASTRTGGRSPVLPDPVWELNLGAAVTWAPSATAAAVYYADNGGMVCAVNPATGDPLWIYREPGEITSRISVRASLIITNTDKLFAYSYPSPDGRQGVSVLDARNGAALWRSHEALGKQATPLLTQSGHVLIAVTEPNQLRAIPMNGAAAEWTRDLVSAPVTITRLPQARN